MQLAGDSKLLQLLKQQYSEADSALQPRLARWKYALDCWRGVSRDGDYYENLGYSAFYNTAPDKEPEWPYGDDTKLRFRLRELFKHVETFLTRLDRAFSSNPRPFSLALPNVSVGMPLPPEQVQSRKQMLAGVTQCLCYDYRNSNISTQQVSAMRDCLIMDIGYTLSKRAEKGKYPRAEMERLFPWDVLPDPLKPSLEKARYCIVRHHFGVSEATERWPESRDAIKSRGTRDRDDNGTSEKRKEIDVLHYYGWYDPKALESALPDDELQDLGTEKALMEIWALGSENGGPSDEILELYKLPFGMQEIPIQSYGILRDPEERGPYCLSLGTILLDGDEAMDLLFNRMLESFEFSVLQGGFFDSAYTGTLQPALLKTPRPGEWKGISMAGGELTKALMPFKYPDVSAAYQQMLGSVRVEDSRVTSVQDQQIGLSAPTQTNTLGEVTLLQNESNEVFRFRAQQLDGSYRRAYRMHVQVFADSLRSWMMENPANILNFLDPETSLYVKIDPSAFDEPWEVELTSGSTLVDGAQRAMQLEATATRFAQAGLPVQGDKVARRILSLRQEDPDLVLGPPGQAEAQAKMAQMMQMAKQGGPPGPIPTGPMPPAQPGLATDAAMAGQMP